MEKAVMKMVKAHKVRDAAKAPPDDSVKVRARIERLLTEARRILEFLATHEERRSEKGAIRKSNITDNDSAKMATSKGVIQGYTAVAAVDAKAQIIVAARAHGRAVSRACSCLWWRALGPCAPDRRSSLPMPATTARRT
jgi:hypothetical protein